jgi:hypothetical protein
MGYTSLSNFALTCTEIITFQCLLIKQWQSKFETPYGYLNDHDVFWH